MTDARDRERKIFEAALEQDEADRPTFVKEACAGDGRLEERIRRLLAAHRRAARAPSRAAAVPDAGEGRLDFGEAAPDFGEGGQDLGEEGSDFGGGGQYPGEDGPGPGGSPPGGRPGDRAGDLGEIGPYRLLERIGEGGMGVVYLAEQARPVRRRVALKIIKAGMDTREVLARFDSERQALALMSHPGIARIFDAGATVRGRPYFVMEHVPGLPVTRYCDERRLGVGERLALFRRICLAVQHAHQKGVIHRDLKPSNILVTEEGGEPLPKIIDFGIAKAANQRLSDLTVHTELGRLIGTPEYMSPEQAGRTALDVDTRADVYSLGVVLYELLCGARPFDFSDPALGYADIQRALQQTDPARPSARMDTLPDGGLQHAARCSTHPAALRRELAGELDWIVTRAMAKEPHRRYPTAQSLADDVERYLRRQPLEARPPSPWYRLAKIVSRNRMAAAVGAVALVVVLAFAGTMAVQARRLARERDRAEAAAARSDRVAAFLAETLGGIDPPGMGAALEEALGSRLRQAAGAPGAPARLAGLEPGGVDEILEAVNTTDLALGLLDREVLRRAAERIEPELAADPVVAAMLHETLGRTYGRLGLYADAEPHLSRAVELFGAELGEEDPETLQAHHQLGLLQVLQGRYADAEPLLTRTVEAQGRVLGEDDLQTLGTRNTLGMLRWSLGQYEEAQAIYEEVLEARRRILGPDHADTLAIVNNLAVMHQVQGRHSEAEPLLEELVEARRRTQGEDHPDTLAAMNNLAILYEVLERHDDAERLHLATLEGRRRALGSDHPDTRGSEHNLGILYWTMGRYDEAERLFMGVLEGHSARLGETHPDTLDVMNSLGILYVDAGRLADADPFLTRALALRRQTLGDEHRSTLVSAANLAELRRRQRRLDDVEALLDEWLPVHRRVLGDEDDVLAHLLFEAACAAAVRGDRAAALERLRQAAAAGLDEAEWVDEDPDLEPLRGDPAFEELAGEVRGRAEGPG